MGHTRDLARFAVGLQYADLPASVIDKAKEIALHSLGVQLAGSTLPWSGSVYRYIKGQGGTPESTVVNFGDKTSAVNAAFANGTFSHAFEMDDNHAITGLKGGSVMVPAVLAMGERQHSPGQESILAIVIGFEIASRLGLSIGALGGRGYHPTGVTGPIGAAAAVARLLHSDEDSMLHAIGIAAAHASGLVESPPSGRGSLKRIFGGMAAASGIRSALLSREGLTGPETMIEGQRGFCHVFGKDPNLTLLTEGLGTEWQILKVHYKLFAQDGYIQPMTEALGRLKERHRFSAEEVDEIRAGVSRHACAVTGKTREPVDLTSAQFSANYSLALFMIKGGAGFHEYTEDSLRDQRIVDLSRRIHLEIDDEIEQEWQRTKPRGARITVRLKSGDIFSEVVPMLRSMTPVEIEDKYRSLATVVVSAEKADRLLRLVKSLETVPDTASLMLFLSQ